jgi:hypothetical protein
MTEEMIKEYLEHHFEPNPADNFRTEDEQRVLDPYPDFQSIGLTHQLKLVLRHEVARLIVWQVVSTRPVVPSTVSYTYCMPLRCVT